MKSKPIGFIGQGWIGKNYADNFEERGYDVVRYALEEPYIRNQKVIKECSVVFVAVPTPTTVDGFKVDAVLSALKSVGDGSTVVIKSTMKPGSTRQLQDQFPHLSIFHSPEFLREKHAREDAAKPKRNIVGVTSNDGVTMAKAKMVLEMLPTAPYNKIMTVEEAELVKYAGNCFLYKKILFMNLLYDLSKELGIDWETVREGLIHDERIGDSHTEPIHQSGHLNEAPTKEVRGAGGHCFIKDFEALKELYRDNLGEDEGYQFLEKSSKYNERLLRSTGKDLDILEEVYGQ
jgi:nucleotide sugar dehydrogenase